MFVTDLNRIEAILTALVARHWPWCRVGYTSQPASLINSVARTCIGAHFITNIVG